MRNDDNIGELKPNEKNRVDELMQEYELKHPELASMSQKNYKSYHNLETKLQQFKLKQKSK